MNNTNTKSKHILVTGGNGFIGSHLVRKLRSQGHTVVSIDSKISLDCNIQFRTERILAEISKADEIYHLAAVSRAPDADRNPEQTYKTNVVGTLNLLEAMRQFHSSVPFVHVSSCVVYGKLNHYMSSKVMGESVVTAYSHTHKLNSAIVRYSNVYGSGVPWNDSLCVAALRRSKHENGYITIDGDGTQVRDFTHVDDIVDGTIRVMATLAGRDGTEPTEHYDLCSGISTSMNELGRYYDCPVRYGPPRPRDSAHFNQDPEPARQKLDWEYTILLQDGIKDVLDDVPEHFVRSTPRVEHGTALETAVAQ